MLSFSEDEFIREQQLAHKQVIWIAELSDGRSVYQDDGREPEPAWIRLSRSGLSIVSLRLQFRRNVVDPLPKNAEGYFYSRGMTAVMGGGCYPFVVIGACAGEDVHVVRYRVPELEKIDEEVRRAADAGNALIMNGSRHGNRTK